MTPATLAPATAATPPATGGRPAPGDGADGAALFAQVLGAAVDAAAPGQPVATGTTPEHLLPGTTAPADAAAEGAAPTGPAPATPPVPDDGPAAAEVASDEAGAADAPPPVGGAPHVAPSTPAVEDDGRPGPEGSAVPVTDTAAPIVTTAVATPAVAAPPAAAREATAVATHPAAAAAAAAPAGARATGAAAGDVAGEASPTGPDSPTRTATDAGGPPPTGPQPSGTGPAQAVVAEGRGDRRPGGDAELPTRPSVPVAPGAARPAATPAAGLPAPDAVAPGQETSGDAAPAAAVAAPAPTGDVAAAEAPHTPPGTPARPATPTGQLAGAVAALRRGGDGEYTASLELHPAELGRVQIDVEVRNGVVHVQLAAEQQGTRALLAGQIAELRAALEQGGMDAGSLDVSQHPDRGAAQDGDRGDRDTPDAMPTTTTDPVRHVRIVPTPTGHRSDHSVDLRV